MSYELIPAVRTVLELSPRPPKRDAFDKVLDLGNFVFGGPVGTIANFANSALQTYALMKNYEQGIKGVHYLTNLEEVRIKSEVEALKIKTAHDSMVLYVENAYQREVDNICNNFQRNIGNIERKTEETIRKIDTYTQQRLVDMNDYYKIVIRENELVCAAYRDFLGQIEREGISKMDVLSSLVSALIEKESVLDDQRFNTLSEIIIKMLEPTDFVDFSDFVEIRNKKLRGMDLLK